ncbi:hypothetical protein Bca4012_027099 [Brassica carinata]|uniref:Uncharacterized protein n=1 Tax=Brassica carinata TaxID=52824 RepID=A0A8X7VJT1_BRACI|nr:hypothetical protein Bca52824_024103 [Brassica carinata]
MRRFNEDDKPLTICESREEKFELETFNGVQDKRDKWRLAPQRCISELSGCLEMMKKMESKSYIDLVLNIWLL